MIFLHAVANLNAGVRCQVYEASEPCIRGYSRSPDASTTRRLCDIGPIVLSLANRSLRSPRCYQSFAISAIWFNTRRIESESRNSNISRTEQPCAAKYTNKLTARHRVFERFHTLHTPIRLFIQFVIWFINIRAPPPLFFLSDTWHFILDVGSKK